MSIEISIDPFDNEISILYKYAEKLEIPTKYIIVKSVDGKDTYISGVDYIKTAVQKGQNLSSILDYINSIDPKTVSYVYAFYKLQSETDTNALVKEINQVYQDFNINPIRNKDELQLIVEEWKNRYFEEYQEDLEKLDRLLNLHEELAKYESLEVSPIKVEKSLLEIRPQIVSKTINGLDIFDSIKLDENVPYVQYNSGTDSYFKLYKGVSDVDIPRYKVIVPTESQASKKETIYFTVWGGTGDISRASNESFIKASYNLKSNIITVKIPDKENKDLILERIQKALPFQLNGDNIKETGISGEFFMYGVGIDYIYFPDMVLNDDLMSTYLFIKEMTHPFADKKQMKIYYHSYSDELEDENVIPSSIGVSIVQFYANGGETISIMKDGLISQRVLEPGETYIRCKITQADSIEVAESFVEIFSRLMNYYDVNKGTVQELYEQFIPELIQVERLGKFLSSPARKGTSKIDKLRDIAPDVFVSGYARRCQRQPIALAPEEVEDWKEQTFVDKDQVKHRQVLSFPKENPIYNFGCSDPEKPYPGLIVNKDLSNKEEYPYLPCCFKVDQTAPGKKTPYNVYTGAVKPDKPVKTSYKVLTDKIAAPGGQGLLPTAITNLVEKYTDDSDIVRMGVMRSPNSLLHCLSVAMNDQKYNNRTNAEREQYISSIRRVIAQRTVPALLKQELYDVDDDEIKRRLSDPDIFLDPNLYYRAVEEVYNLNVYVFGLDKNGSGDLETPRFNLFHSEFPSLDRMSVLIYRTWGSDTDNLTYPQCELIVAQNRESGDMITVFPSDMSKFMHNALLNMNRTITWELTAMPDGKTETVARDNIYSLVNYYDLIQRSATKQILDDYGKLRGLVFPKSLDSTVSDEEITMIIPPGQPQNLPTTNIVRSTFQSVIQVFGLPTSVTRNLQGDITGLWYPILDLTYGIYMPIKIVQKSLVPPQLDLPDGPANDMVEPDGEDVAERLFKLRRDLNIITQVLVWLFIIARSVQETISVSEFINSHMAIGNDVVEDSATVYDFSNIGRKFPPVKTVEEGIEEMSRRVPTLFTVIDKKRILLYSRKFFDGILYYMEKYVKEYLKPETPIPLHIEREVLVSSDFKEQPNVAVFTNRADMSIWLKSHSNLFADKIVIHDKLDVSRELLTEPYLYTSPIGKIYMIQNVIEGQKMRAINVALEWYLRKINLGYNSQGYEETPPVHVVYGVSTALTPVLLENKAGETTNYLQLIRYSPGKYAAMLPLL